MSEALIRAQIKTVLLSVGTIEIVHDYQRWANDWAKFLDLFQTTDDRIAGWVVTRSKVVTRRVNVGETDICHVFTLRGYLGLQDAAASEHTFQTEIDAVQTALLADEQLGDTCNTTHPDWGPMSGSVGLQADKIDLRRFGTVFCHFFEGRICAEETIQA